MCFFAIDINMSCIALVSARQDLDEGRLSSTVVAEETDYLTRVDVNCGMVDGFDTAEGDGDVPHFDQRSGGSCLSLILLVLHDAFTFMILNFD